MSDSYLEKQKDKAQKDLPLILDTNTLYKEFIGLTDIERVKEEDFVMKSLLKGKSKSEIRRDLQEKHPDYSFSSNDLEKFLSKNPEVLQAMGKSVENAAKRYFNAKEQVSQHMFGLISYTEQLIPQIRAEGDNTNTVAAIRALQNAYMNFAKLEGFTKDEDGKVNVNIVQQLSEGKSDAGRKVVDAEYSVDDE